MIKVKTKALEAIETTNILTQSSYWASVKSKQGFKPKGFEVSVPENVIKPSGDETKHHEDDLIVLIDQVSEEHSYAYVPYGPKIEPDIEAQGIFLEHLSEQLKDHLPQSCTHIRYDLMWRNQWSEDEELVNEEGELIAWPSTHSQEF